MIRRPQVALFCEDAGHEAFARALVSRLAEEADLPRPDLSVRSGRGGHGRTITEFTAWQRTLTRAGERAEIVVVMIDGNGEGWAAQHRAVTAAVVDGLFANVVVGVPDPHVEAWCAADLQALQAATGAVPPPPPARPGRTAHKRWLADCLAAAGVEILNDPMDIAAELAPYIDLYRAAKQSPSLGHFVFDMRKVFARLRAGPVQASQT